MTFGQSIQTVFRKYAEFNGRASRSEFWWFVLFSALVGGALSSIFPGLGAAWSFAVLLPSLAVSVRRLRDAGLAWQWLFFILLPFVGAIVLIVLYTQPSKQDSGAEIPATRIPPEPAS